MDAKPKDTAGGAHYRGKIPKILAWYREEDWKEWKRLCPGQMCETWDEWIAGADRHLLQSAKERVIVYTSTIRPAAYISWAEANGREISGHSRGEYAAFLIKDRFLQSYEPPESFPKNAEVLRSLRKILKDNPDVSMSDVGDPYLRRPEAAVLPLFREDSNGRPEQFGSGVLVQVGDQRFLISAAHVFDEFTSPPILIPGKEGLTGVKGEYFITPLPESGARRDDLLDLGFLPLSSGSELSLNDSMIFLDHRDCDAMDETAEEDAYTVIGYQADLSDVGDEIVQSRISRIGCSGVQDHRYEKLGLDPRTHLLLQYRMKKGVIYRTLSPGKKHNFEGISGGGVFAWSKDLPNPHAMDQPLLVGIVTDYSPHHNVFVATRLGVLLAGIQKRFPHLPLSPLDQLQGGPRK
jgi:hypothetical protein